MTDRGWTSSREQLLQGALLDWVYESTKGNTVPRLASFMVGVPDVDEETLKGLVAALESGGLMHIPHVMAGLVASGAHLPDAGRALVRARHERRSNAKARATASR